MRGGTQARRAGGSIPLHTAKTMTKKHFFLIGISAALLLISRSTYAAEPVFIASSSLPYANVASPRTVQISVNGAQYVGVQCVAWFSPSATAHTLSFNGSPMRFVSSTITHMANEELSLWRATTSPSVSLRTIELSYSGIQQSMLECSSFSNSNMNEVSSSSVRISGGNDNRFILNGTSTMNDQRLWGVARETVGTTWTPVPTSTIEIVSGSGVGFGQGMEIPFSSVSSSYHEIRWNFAAAVNQGGIGLLLEPYQGVSGDQGYGGTPAIWFNLPTEGAVLPDFSRWEVYRNGIAEVGTIQVQYYLDQQGFTQTYIDRFVNFPPLVTANPFPLTKRYPLDLSASISSAFPTSTPWRAQVWYLSTTSTILAQSQEIHFRISRTAPIPNSSTTQIWSPNYFGSGLNGSTSPSGLSFPTSTAGYNETYCPPAEGFTDFGGGFRYGWCWFGKMFLNYEEGAFDFAKYQWTTTQSLPPFSVIFKLASSTRQGLTAASTTSPGVLRVGVFGLDRQMHYQVIASSTSLQDILVTASCNASCATERKDLTFLYETYAIWIGAAIGGWRIIMGG